jgi:hypothetical protein
MKIFLWTSVISFTVGSIFDVLTTLLGIVSILGNGAAVWFLGLAVTFVVFVLNSRIKEVFVEKQWWLMPFCVLALVFDFYTSLTGEQYLPSDMQGAVVSNSLGWITLIFISFFFVASPVLLSDSIRKLNLFGRDA